jgi:hypothetical protein
MREKRRHMTSGTVRNVRTVRTVDHIFDHISAISDGEWVYKTSTSDQSGVRVSGW